MVEYFSTTRWDGAVDLSWYNGTDTEFTLTTPAQLAGLAALVNSNTADFAGKTIRLGADISLLRYEEPGKPGETASCWWCCLSPSARIRRTKLHREKALRPHGPQGFPAPVCAEGEEILRRRSLFSIVHLPPTWYDNIRNEQG